jgi:hypothetical protein
MILPGYDNGEGQERIRAAAVLDCIAARIQRDSSMKD